MSQNLTPAQGVEKAEPKATTSPNPEISLKYKGKDLKVLTKTQENNPNTFYNATSIYRTLDLPASQEPDKWLRLNDTKQFMLQNTDKINPLKKEVEKQKLFYSSRMVRLPKEIESAFTYQVKGRNGGTYMRKELFLKYMAHLDKKLEWEIIQTFVKYGHLEKLDPAKKTDALLNLTEQAVADGIQQNTGSNPSKARTLARFDGMVKQRSLNQILCSILGTHGLMSDKVFAEEFLRKVYLAIYQTCFNQAKDEMLELLERKSGLIRDFMSDDALDVLNAAETMIQVKLSIAKRSKVNLTWDFMHSVIVESCQDAIQIPFRYKQQIDLLHRDPTKQFKKEIDVKLTQDGSILKSIKYIANV